jgi:hypothetical protein
MKTKELKITPKGMLVLHAAPKTIKRKKNHENSTANLRSIKASLEGK